MAAIISGNSLGLSTSSLRVLGDRGAFGNASQGRSGEGVYVDVSNGNLVVQRRDELLAGLGLSIDTVRTYNSQGTLDGDNNDNWRIGFYKRVFGLTGAINGAGSTLRRQDGDGAEAVYAFDGSRGAYVSTAGDGAYDTIAYNQNGTWTWTDGATQVSETYAGTTGLITDMRDLAGNTLAYTYGANNLLASVQNSSGEKTLLVYDGFKLTDVQVQVTVGGTTTLTSRTHYAYDGSSRLVQIRVDLTPEDTTDARFYETSYTYEGASNRIRTLAQTDGTLLTFGYVLAGSDYKVASIVDGLGHETKVTYSGLSTFVDDPLGLRTTFTYDAIGQLTKVTSPAVGGAAAETRFDYDGSGNVVKVTDGEGRFLEMSYSPKGAQVLQRDSLGNTVTRTFDAKNLLKTETVWSVADSDGAGSASEPQSPSTRRLVNDERGLPRYEISAEGRVTRHDYSATGQLTATVQYTGAAFDVAPYDINASPTVAVMDAWAGALSDKRQVIRTDFAYDFRGQVASMTTYEKIDVNGAGIVDGTQATTRYVYDAAGQLRKTVLARQLQPNVDVATDYAYDGLGRVIATTDGLGQAIVNVYDDAGRKTIVKLANNLWTTSFYDVAGQLVKVAQSEGAAAELGRSLYFYDADGRLRETRDPTGVRHLTIYDEKGRKSIEIDGDGSATEYLYDRGDLPAGTIRYANRVDWSAIPDDATGTTRASLNLSVSAKDRVTRNAYDRAGRLVKALDEEQSLTEYVYDGASRVTDIVRYANPATIEFAQGAGDVVQVISVTPSANDRRTRNLYDRDGLLAGVIDAGGYLTEYRYNSAGKRIETIRHATPLPPPAPPPAATPTPPVAPLSSAPRTNFAAATSGGIATSSSNYSAAFPAAAVINGDRAGQGWSAGGVWNDGTPGTYPDWVQVDFRGAKTIDQVVLYTIQDNPYTNPAEPTDAMTFANFGVLDFTVEGWNGASWVTLGTVAGNTLVKRTVNFAAFTTDRIRVNVSRGSGGYSAITEIEAWGVEALPGSRNVAAASAGAVATASSMYSAAYGPDIVNNGERTGLPAANYGGYWNDATYNTYPDWVQIDFNGAKVIDQVVLFSMQDNYSAPVEPNSSTTFSVYGVQDFEVQGWNGSSWITLGTVTGNNLARRSVSFASFTTSRIRVNVTRGASGWTPVTEVEAWGIDALPGSRNVALATDGARMTASSVYSQWYGPDLANNGDRTGVPVAGVSGGYWNDGTGNVYPDWLQVEFNGTKILDHVVVYAMQDNYTAPIEPTPYTTFMYYGPVDFEVQGWNGTSWVTLATVAGNNQVRRVVNFAAFSTDRIRVNVTRGGSGWAAIAEVEAWGVDALPGSRNLAAASEGAVASASSVYSAAYGPTNLNNGERAGVATPALGGYFLDATYNTYPDWLQIDLNGPKVVDHVVLYAFQDNYTAPVEPTAYSTFAYYGPVDFDVQGWNGSSWVTLATVTGNNLVKRTVNFAAFATDKIRVNVSRGASAWTSVTELEVWGTDALPGSMNVASASAGAMASASSTYSAGYSPSGVIDGNRPGTNWGSGTGWTEGAAGNAIYPDWLQVDFNGLKTIDNVVVYSVQDIYNAPSAPTDTMVFNNYGLVDFAVEGWNGSAWVTLGTVNGNTLVKRRVRFAAFTTDRIRINVTRAKDGWSRATEVEAFGVAAGEAPTNVALASAGAVTSASSTGGGNGTFPLASLNNGDRAGAGWTNGGGWRDATPDSYPDWVQVDFAGAKTIDRVVVSSLQDAVVAPVQSVDGLTGAAYVTRDFTVQGWNGAGWVTLATVTGNNLIKRTVTFGSFTTDRIRINITGTPSNYARITEIEAWGTPAAGVSPVMAAAAVVSAPAGDDIHEYAFYNARGLLAATLDAEGGLTDFTYDQDGNLARKVRYATKIASPAAAALGVARPTSGADETFEYTYDTLNRRATERDPGGLVTTYTYDNVGQLVSTTRAASLSDKRTLTARYDIQGRLVGELSAKGSALLTGNETVAQLDALYATHGTRHEYDAAGRRTRSTDANGHRTIYFHDRDGRVTHTINSLGEIERREYNAFNQLETTTRYGTAIQQPALAGLAGGLENAALAAARVADPLGDSISRLFYNARGLVETSYDGVGNDTIYLYNAFGEMSSRSERSDASRRLVQAYEYNRRGLLAKAVREPAGANLPVVTEYDAFGRATAVTEGGSTRRRTYDKAGREITTSIDGIAGVRTTTYDALGRVLKVRDAVNPEGKETVYTYETASRTVSVTTPELVVTKTIRNAYGETREIVDGRGNSAKYSYDVDGNLFRIERAGEVVEKTFDNMHLVIDERRPNDPSGAVTRFVYDGANRLVHRIVDFGPGDPARLNLATTTVYDAKGQVVTVFEPKGRSVSLVDGEVVVSMPASAVRTKYEWDLEGRLAKETVDAGGLALATTYAYDGLGGVLEVKRPNGLVTRYVYDTLGRRTEEHIDPPGAGSPVPLDLVTRYDYNARDQVSAVTDARNNRTLYVRDAADRVIFTVNAQGEVEESAYDGENRVTRTVDYAARINMAGLSPASSVEAVRARLLTGESDRVTTHILDRDGREVRTVDANGGVTERVFDGNGNVIRRAIADQVESYFHDAADRLKLCIDALRGVKTYDYDANGNLVQTNAYATPIPAGTAMDEATLRQAAENARDFAHDRRERRYYDAAGRLTTTVDGTGAVAITEYDANGRVAKTLAYREPITLGGVFTTAPTDVLVPESAVRARIAARPATDRETRYTYDAAGRVTLQVDGAGAATAIAYDRAGNVIEKAAYAAATVFGGPLPAATAADRHDRFYYDAGGRMTFSIDGLGAVTQQLYDGKGNVLERIRYASFHQGPWPLDEAAMKTAAANLPNAALNQRERFRYDAENRLTYSADANGAVTRRVYDAKGNVVQRIEYVNTVTAGIDPAAVVPNDFDHVSRFAYDPGNRLAVEVNPVGEAAEYIYDAVGNLTEKRSLARPPRIFETDVAARIVRLAYVSPDPTDRIERQVFDATGRVAYSVDAKGFVRSNEYDALGQVTRTVGYAKVLPQTTAVTLAGLRAEYASIVTADREELLEHDAQGRVTGSRDANGAWERYEYDAVGNRRRFVDKRGSEWTYEHDAQGNLGAEHSPVVRVSTIAEVNGRYAAQAEAKSLTTTLRYDALGRVIARTEFDGLAAYQRTTRYEYDAEGRQVRIRHPAVDVYDAATGLTQSKDLTTEVGYDALGRAVWNKDVADHYTHKAYDLAGRVRYEVDAEGGVTEYGRDVFGQVTRTIRHSTPLNLSGETRPVATARIEQLLAAQTAAQRANDRVIETTYDAGGRIWGITEGRGFAYDLNNPLSGIETTRLTRTMYNMFGQAVWTGTSLDTTGTRWTNTTFFYDKRGDKALEVDALGYATEFEYDAAGNMVRKTEFAAPLPSWNSLSNPSWDPLPAIPASVANHPDNRTTRYEYDELGRKTKEKRIGVDFSDDSGLTGTRGDVETQYAYDAAGNLLATTTADGTAYSFHDRMGRIYAVKAPERADVLTGVTSSPMTRFHLDAAGNTVQRIDYAGSVSDIGLDDPVPAPAGADRVTSVRYDAHGKAVETEDGEGHSRFSSYDAAGNLLRQREAALVRGAAGEIVKTYKYDTLGRETESAQLRADGAPIRTQTLYNAFGEVVAKGVNDAFDEFYDYDNLGRLWRTNAGDGVVKVFFHDLSGAVTSEIRSATANLKASYASAKEVSLNLGVMTRTDYRRDLLGRVVEERLPATSADSGANWVPVIGTDYSRVVAMELAWDTFFLGAAGGTWSVASGFFRLDDRAAGRATFSETGPDGTLSTTVVYKQDGPLAAIKRSAALRAGLSQSYGITFAQGMTNFIPMDYRRFREDLENDFLHYFETPSITLGTELDWMGGKIKRGAGDTATYTDPNGVQFAISRSKGPLALLAASVHVREGWARFYSLPFLGDAGESIQAVTLQSRIVASAGPAFNESGTPYWTGENAVALAWPPLAALGSGDVKVELTYKRYVLDPSDASVPPSEMGATTTRSDIFSAGAADTGVTLRWQDPEALEGGVARVLAVRILKKDVNGAWQEIINQEPAATLAVAAAVTTGDTSGALWRDTSTGNVYRMTANGFAAATDAMAYAAPSATRRIVGDADFNGDGARDLVVRDSATGQVSIVQLDASGKPVGGGVVFTEPDPAWQIVNTPDLDSDGRADLLWWNSTTGQVRGMLMNGATVVSQSVFYTEPNTAWKIVAVGDFAGSGKRNQVVWRNDSTGQVYLMTVNAAGGALTQSGLQIYQEPNLAWKIVGAADFNGDGKSDLLWRNDVDGRVHMMLMNGPAIANQAQVYNEPNLAWKIVALGDYDGDGRGDVVWRNESTGQFYKLAMNGFAVASQGFITQQPVAAASMTLAAAAATPPAVRTYLFTIPAPTQPGVTVTVRAAAAGTANWIQAAALGMFSDRLLFSVPMSNGNNNYEVYYTAPDSGGYTWLHSTGTIDASIPPLDTLTGDWIPRVSDASGTLKWNLQKAAVISAGDNQIFKARRSMFVPTSWAGYRAAEEATKQYWDLSLVSVGDDRAWGGGRMVKISADEAVFIESNKGAFKFTRWQSLIELAWMNPAMRTEWEREYQIGFTQDATALTPEPGKREGFNNLNIAFDGYFTSAQSVFNLRFGTLTRTGPDSATFTPFAGAAVSFTRSGGSLRAAALSDDLRRSWNEAFDVGLAAPGWTELAITNDSVQLSQLGPGSFQYELVRLHGATPFAHAVGTATVIPATTTITVGPSNIPGGLGTPSEGRLRWTVEPEVTRAEFRYRLQGAGSWISIDAQIVNNGFEVSVLGLATGTYQFEVNHYRATALKSRMSGTFFATAAVEAHTETLPAIAVTLQAVTTPLPDPANFRYVDESGNYAYAAPVWVGFDGNGRPIYGEGYGAPVIGTDENGLPIYGEPIAFGSTTTAKLRWAVPQNGNEVVFEYRRYGEAAWSTLPRAVEGSEFTVDVSAFGPGTYEYRVRHFDYDYELHRRLAQTGHAEGRFSVEAGTPGGITDSTLQPIPTPIYISGGSTALITWAAPSGIQYQNFRYRRQGDVNWTLSNPQRAFNSMRVALIGVPAGTYEYQLTYTLPDATQPYAQKTGTFTLGTQGEGWVASDPVKFNTLVNDFNAYFTSRPAGRAEAKFGGTLIRGTGDAGYFAPGGVYAFSPQLGGVPQVLNENATIRQGWASSYGLSFNYIPGQWEPNNWSIYAQMQADIDYYWNNMPDGDFRSWYWGGYLYKNSYYSATYYQPNGVQYTFYNGMTPIQIATQNDYIRSGWASDPNYYGLQWNWRDAYYSPSDYMKYNQIVNDTNYYFYNVGAGDVRSWLYGGTLLHGEGQTAYYAQGGTYTFTKQDGVLGVAAANATMRDGWAQEYGFTWSYQMAGVTGAITDTTPSGAGWTTWGGTPPRYGHFNDTTTVTTTVPRAPMGLGSFGINPATPVPTYTGTAAAYSAANNPNPGSVGLSIDSRVGADAPLITASTLYASPTSTPSIQKTYDRWGNLLSVSDPRATSYVANDPKAAWKTTYTYNASNQVLSESKAPAQVVSELNFVETKASTTQVLYDRAGRVVATVDPNGRRNRIVYDKAGQVVREIHADDGVERYVYNAFGERTLRKDARDNETEFRYDRAGRLTTETYAATAVYQGTGGSSVLAGFGRRTVTYAYDDAGRRIAVTTGSTLANTPTHALGYEYDERGNITRATTPMGLNTELDWDVYGNKKLERDAEGKTQSWTYNAFGRLDSHVDLAGIATSYTFDKAGHVTRQSSGRGQEIRFAYDAAGRVTRIQDFGESSVTTYEYDKAGNRTLERMEKGGVVYQDNRNSYDSQGRLVEVVDSRHHAWLAYDAAGNRRFIKANYIDDASPQLRRVENWYTYDGMNRVLVENGVWSATGVRINDTQGIAFSYDKEGNKQAATQHARAYNLQGTGGDEGMRDVTDHYKYDAENRLEEVRQTAVGLAVTGNFNLTSERTYDALGRVETERIYNLGKQGLALGIDGGDDRFDTRHNDYDANARLTLQTTIDAQEGINNNNHVRSTVTFNGYDKLGNVTQYTLNDRSGTNDVYKYSYIQDDAYKTSSIEVWRGGSVAASTTFTYDRNAQLKRVSDSVDSLKNRRFATDFTGATYARADGVPDSLADIALTPDGLRAAGGTQARVQHSLVVNGETLGLSAHALGDTTPAVSRFDFGTHGGDATAGTAGHYVVTRTDAALGLASLKSVAQAVYGESGLWYVIAEANGLTKDSQVVEGMSLTIPGNVSSSRNDASTFRPYDPTAIKGDNMPALPIPQADDGCGTMGVVIVAIVAIVVTYFTAGAAAPYFASLGTTGSAIATAAVSAAAGNIAGQVVGNALGIQDGFSWKSVAASAISGGITQGVDVGGLAGLSGNVGVAAQSAFNSVVNQGVNVALGLQPKFSWAAVAASAVVAPFANYLGTRVGSEVGNGVVGKIAGGFTQGFVTQAAVKAARGGSIKWENIAADAFGNALGQGLADSMQPRLNALDYEDLERGQVMRANLAAAAAPILGRLGSGTYGLAKAPGAEFLTVDPTSPKYRSSEESGTILSLPQMYEERFGLKSQVALLTPDMDQGELIPTGGYQGLRGGRNADLAMGRVPPGFMTTEGVSVAGRNMSAILNGRKDPDIFDLIAGTQTPAMMKRWVAENKDTFARHFAGELTFAELGYLGQRVPGNIVSPVDLSTDQLAEASRLYGDESDAAMRFANYRNRAAIVNYMTSAVALNALGATWDFVRDLNPVLFAYERGYRLQSGTDAWAGAPVDRGAAAAEFAIGVFAPKVIDSAVGGRIREWLRPIESSSGLLTSLQPYTGSELNAALRGSGIQRHHINESAIYGKFIPKDDGLTVPLEGWGTGTAHTNYHAAMREFFKPFQEGGSLFGLRPTNLQVYEAQTAGYLAAGFTRTEALYLAGAARAERLIYGLKDAANVPRIPGK